MMIQTVTPCYRKEKLFLRNINKLDLNCIDQVL
ncbi:MAG: hypothetical protein MAG581_00673 [Deltaproteobacteria bacterium]|nr:hypothetical protein [Deltaproteobacteria bacterium]